MMERSFVLAALLSAGCVDAIRGLVGPSSAITGTVVGPYGQSLPGVEVKILKSTYSSISGEDGTYEVPFAPGSFQVSYTLDGYTSQVLDLDIQQSTKFPAEVVTLFPRPQGEGIFHLGRNGLESLQPADMDVQVVQAGWFETRSKFFCTGEGQQSWPASELQFIDKLPSAYDLARLGDYGLAYEPDESTENKGYNGLMTGTREEIGTEKEPLRAFSGQAGQYAWVPVKRNSKGEATSVDGSKPCFPFKVTSG